MSPIHPGHVYSVTWTITGIQSGNNWIGIRTFNPTSNFTQRSFSFAELGILSERDEVSRLFWLVEHGFTTKAMSMNLSETYTVSGNNVDFINRNQWWAITSSRPHWDNPYTATVTPISHVSSAGSQLRSFSMRNADGLFPGGLWVFGTRENSTVVRYNRFNTNRSRFSITTTASGLLNPDSFITELELAVH